MRGAPSVSLGLDAEPPEREPKEEDDGHGHHAEHERGACATAHGAPRLPHEPRARENTVEASAMISSGVDVTGPNTGCELYLAVPPRVSAPHHTLPRARTAARRLASAARDAGTPSRWRRPTRWSRAASPCVGAISRLVASTLDLARPVAPSRLVSLDRPLAHAPPRVHLSQATARDVFAPVYIVLLLVILKLLVGEESLPVPELPRAVRLRPGGRRGLPARRVLALPHAHPAREDPRLRPREPPRGGRGHARPSPASRSPPRIPDPPPPSSSRGSTTPTNSLLYRAEPHQLYAGVLFPRLLDGEKDEDAPRLDEPFSVLVNGSYVPLPRATGAWGGRRVPPAVSTRRRRVRRRRARTTSHILRVDDVPLRRRDARPIRRRLRARREGARVVCGGLRSRRRLFPRTSVLSVR